MKDYFKSVQALTEQDETQKNLSQAILPGIRVTTDYDQLRPIKKIKVTANVPSATDQVFVTIPDDEEWEILHVKVKKIAGTYSILQVLMLTDEGERIRNEDEGTTVFRYNNNPVVWIGLPGFKIGAEITTWSVAGNATCWVYYRRKKVVPMQEDVF